MPTYSILPAQKIKDFLINKLNSIHTGRVTPATLDQIYVEAYGTKMSVRELATISVPEPGQLLVTPFDKSVNNAIEKAVRDSNLGVNPVNDGAGVRLVFPPLTEENRRNRVKEVYKMLEEARISLRQQRQDVLKDKKAQKEASLISEDDLKNFEKELQAEVDNLNKDLEEQIKHKEEELMRV